MVYLVDAGGVEVVRKEARRLGVAIAACPAVVFECLRAPLDPAAKRARVEALTRGSWQRLMPEAFKESEEARRAIGRARPNWINPAPDLREWIRIRADWESAWWLRARRDTEEEGNRIRQLDGSTMGVAREDAAGRRRSAREGGLTFDSIDFDWVAVPETRQSWWDGAPVEPWRLELANVLLHALRSREGAFHDWLSPWLRTGVIDERGWFGLWTREVSREEMPLAWLRWAFEFVQATRTTTNGTRVDNQIATYLPECDVFVTADKAFAECVEKVRPHAPVALGRAHRLPSNEAAVDGLVDLLTEMAG